VSRPDAVVYVDLEGESHLVGSLWVRFTRGGQHTASFRYAESWMESDQAFAVDPLLSLTSGGVFHKDRLFGAIGDSAPDRWGRTLLARAERVESTREGRAPRTLSDLDFVLGVSDRTRQGALRFALVEDGEFLAPEGDEGVPPLIQLGPLMAAAQGLIDDPDDHEALRLLLAPGSSLGGARPKASVLDAHGRLSIAKFPRRDDGYSIGRWEHLTLEIAREAGIRAAESQIVRVDGLDVLLLPRFDRDGDVRIPFLSALSMVDAEDQEVRSYLELAEVLRQHGAHTRTDLKELWRRVVFNVLVSNTDDHLRNHGFMYAGQGGWTLSPAYDLNPTPTEIRPRFLATAIGIDLNDTSASLSMAFSVARYFDLEEDEARYIAREVAEVTRHWADRAGALGVPGREVDFMSSAFEHEDLRLALGS
jgi:serine/threonine-protein kinase HipA